MFVHPFVPQLDWCRHVIIAFKANYSNIYSSVWPSVVPCAVSERCRLKSPTISIVVYQLASAAAIVRCTDLWEPPYDAVMARIMAFNLSNYRLVVYRRRSRHFTRTLVRALSVCCLRQGAPGIDGYRIKPVNEDDDWLGLGWFSGVSQARGRFVLNKDGPTSAIDQLSVVKHERFLLRVVSIEAIVSYRVRVPVRSIFRAVTSSSTLRNNR